MFKKIKILKNKDGFLEIVNSIKEYIVNYFPKYKLKPSNTIPVMTDERLPWGPTILLSFQHVLAMFGATVVGPMLMGFSSNTALLFSGIGTLIFYVCTGGKVPSFLGSSFAFVGVINSASGYIYKPGGTLNQHIPEASGGILVCGLIYLLISLIVIIVGSGWLVYLTPPVVTGSIVISIGLSLAVSAIGQANRTGFDAWMAMVTVVLIVLCTCYAPGPFKRLPILIGGVLSYVIYLLFGLGGIGEGINFEKVRDAKWIGAPPTTSPLFVGSYISLIAPVSIILAAENVGHLKAIAAMTDKNLDHLLGRTFLGDAVATTLAGACGSIGTTTYAENLGVMSITKIFSTLSFIVSGIIAVCLGFVPVFGAVVNTIPSGVFGGITIILYGIISMTGCKLFIDGKVDFSKPRNLLTAGISIVLGVGMVNVVVSWGPIKLDGIGCSTFSAIILYQLLRDDWGIIFRKLLTKITGRNFMKPQCSDNSQEEIIINNDDLQTIETLTDTTVLNNSSSTLEMDELLTDSNETNNNSNCIK